MGDRALLALRCGATVGGRCVAVRLLAGAALPHTPRRVACRAVGPRGRLRCDARGGVAPPNSLRSLRSLRSDNGGESVDEARCARRPRRCASRRPRRPRAWGRASTRVLAGVAFGVRESARASSMPLSRQSVRKESVRAEPFDCAQDRLVEALQAGRAAHQEARICVSVDGRQRGSLRASHSVCLSQPMRLPCPCPSTVSAKNPFGLSPSTALRTGLSKPCWRDKALTRKQGFATLWLVLTSCSSTAVGLPDPSSSPETHP
jgi:hypothetical protein